MWKGINLVSTIIISIGICKLLRDELYIYTYYQFFIIKKVIGTLCHGITVGGVAMTTWRRRRHPMQSYINLSLAPHPPTSRTHPSTLTHASSCQFLAPIGEMDPTTPTSCESTTDSCSSTSTCGSQVSRYAHTKSQVSFTY